MTTTIEPEGDPTFLAYERARQYGESTLAPRAGRDQAVQAARVQNDGIGLALDQTQRVDDNMASHRARGFGQSGERAQAEDRIRSDIAQRVQSLLLNNMTTTNSITDGMLDDLAALGMTSQEEQLAARNRLTQAQAKSGVGI